MRLKIIFANPDQHIELPVNYHQILQGLIYRTLDRDQEFQSFIHDYGYFYKNRKFKAFTYSRLFGNTIFEPRRKTLIFKSPITWYISSAMPKFIELLGQAFLLKEQFLLFKKFVTIEQLQYEKDVPIQNQAITIQMLSPITVYSTFKKANGKNLTQYYSPFDLAFPHLIEENARKKYEAFFQRPMNDSLSIQPVKVNARDKVVTKYKDTIINGWTGIYRLEGPVDLLQFLYNSGIGSKNSQGFGMFQVIEGNRNSK